MQEYPEQGSIERCPKCGTYTNCATTIRWIDKKVGFKCVCGAKTEHMCVECWKCRYHWAEAVMGGMYELDPKYKKVKETKEPRKSWIARMFGK